jgi:hypothetical protein
MSMSFGLAAAVVVCTYMERFGYLFLIKAFDFLTVRCETTADVGTYVW